MTKLVYSLLLLFALTTHPIFAGGPNNAELDECINDTYQLVCSFVSSLEDDVERKQNILNEKREAQAPLISGYEKQLDVAKFNFGNFIKLKEAFDNYRLIPTTTKEEKKTFINELFYQSFGSFQLSITLLGDKLRAKHLIAGIEKFSDYRVYPKGLDKLIAPFKKEDGSIPVTLFFNPDFQQILSCYSKEEAFDTITALQSLSHNLGVPLDTYEDQIQKESEYEQELAKINKQSFFEWVPILKTLMVFADTSKMKMEDNPYLHYFLNGQFTPEEEARVHKHRLYKTMITYHKVKKQPFNPRKREISMRKRLEFQLGELRKIEEKRWQRFNVPKELRIHSIVPDIDGVLVEEAQIWRPIPRDAFTPKNIEVADITPAPSHPTVRHFDEQPHADPKEVEKRHAEKAAKKAAKAKGTETTDSSKDHNAASSEAAPKINKRLVSAQTMDVVKKLCRVHHDGQQGVRVLDWDSELAPAFNELANGTGFINAATGSSARQFVYGSQKYVIHKPHGGSKSILGKSDTNRAEEMFRLFGWTIDTLTDETETSSAEENTSDSDA